MPRSEVENANRNQLWDWVKQADPENQLGLNYGGSDAADADEMREELLAYYDFDDE